MATTLTIVNNVFDRSDYETKEIYAGFSLFHYLKDFDEDLEPKVSVNGKITEDFEYMIMPNDKIIVVPLPKGGDDDGKSIIGLIATVVLTYVSGGVAGFLTGSTSGFAFNVVRAVVMVAGGMLINQLMPTSNLAQGTNKDLEKASPTYGFGNQQNAAQEGTYIPLMVGERRVTPPIKSYYLQSDGDKQRLNILYSVCEGEIDNISDIEIDGQPITNYSDVQYDFTLGTEQQGTIGNFRDTTSTFDVSVNLNTNFSETVYTTAGNTVNQAEVCMALDRGLFLIDDEDGDYRSRTITYTISYRKNGTTDGWVNIPQSFSGVYKTIHRRTIAVQFPEAGKYDIKIQRTSSFSTNSRVANSLLVDYVNEVVYDGFQYPGEALLSINALATDQLEGSFPRVTCIATNKLAEGFTLRSKDNPAWACYYILKKIGIEDNEIDIAAFEDWATFCDDNNYKVSLYIDGSQEVQTILDMLSIIGRATVVQFGSEFAPIVNRPLATNELIPQEFVFNRANIIDGDFKLSYMPYRERANVVEITYYDKEDGYTAKTVTVEADTYDATQKEIKFSKVLYACTDKETAARLAKLYINQNKYLSETVNFTAANDAIICKVGDIISCGVKYMTNTLADGRLVEVQGNFVQFDSPVDLEQGQEYEIEMRLENDDIELFYYTHNDADTQTDTIEILNMPTVENPLNVVYAVGKTELGATDKFRVIDISRNNDLTRKITAVEYNSTVYDDFVDVEIEPVEVLDSVENLKVTEQLYKDAVGKVIEILVLTWASQVDDIKKVYLNETYIGETKENRFEITRDLIEGQTYTIRVNNSTKTHTFIGRHTPYPIDNIQTETIGAVTSITWNSSDDLNFDYYDIEVGGVTYASKTNALAVELDTGTHVVRVRVVNNNGTSSEYATSIFGVTQPTIRELTQQAFLLEKAFRDGLVSIFVGESADKTTATNYDLWRLSPTSLTLGELQYSSQQLKFLTWKDFQNAENVVYKYFLDGEWLMATAEQRLIIEKSLGYVSTQSLEDGAYRIFNTTPYPPYNIGDLWLFGDKIRVATTDNPNSFVLGEWLDSTDDRLNISPDVDDSQVVKDEDGTTEVVRAGLNTTPTKLGYFDGIRWRSYMDSEGKFLFSNADESSYIKYDGNELNIKGKIIAESGSDVGNTTYRQDTTPTNPKEGDLWFNTGTDEFSRYNGTIWEDYDPALAINSGTTTINGGKITTDSIEGSSIKADTIEGSSIKAATINANRLGGGRIVNSAALQPGGNIDENSVTMDINLDSGWIYIK